MKIIFVDTNCYICGHPLDDQDWLEIDLIEDESQRFCEKHKKEILNFIEELKTKESKNPEVKPSFYVCNGCGVFYNRYQNCCDAKEKVDIREAIENLPKKEIASIETKLEKTGLKAESEKDALCRFFQNEIRQIKQKKGEKIQC